MRNLTGKTQVFTIVPEEIKARLHALKLIDKALYSETRVIWRCIAAHLHVIEKEASEVTPFYPPTPEASGKRRRQLQRA